MIYLLVLSLLVGQVSRADEACDRSLQIQSQQLMKMHDMMDKQRDELQVAIAHGDYYRVKSEAWYRQPGNIIVLTLITTLLIKSQIDQRSGR